MAARVIRAWTKPALAASRVKGRALVAGASSKRQLGAGVQGVAGGKMTDGATAAAPASTPSTGSVRRPQIVAVMAAALLPLAATPVVPLIDFYNHIARLAVLAGISGNPVYSANYAPAWSMLPNIGLDVIGLVLLQLVPIALVPHVVAALIIALILVGSIALNRAVTGQTSWPALLLTVPLLYSWIFNWGFANFLLGVGVSLLAAAWWLARRDRPWLRMPVALLLGIIIFFCHALAFGLYGILIASLELGQWLQQPGRRWAGLISGLGQCAAQAVVPGLLFLQSRTAAVAGGITNADESLARLKATGRLFDRLIELAMMRLETIVRVAEGPSYAADALWLVALVVVLLLAARRRALALSPIVLPALLAAGLLVVAMPPALFGSGYVADRMPLFLALVLVAGIMPGPGRVPWLVPGLAMLAGLRLLLLAAQWHMTAADLVDFDRVAARLPPGQIVAGIPVGAGPHEDMPRRCEMYPPLLLLRHGQAVPLFAIRAAQPLEHRGKLAAARDALTAQHLGPADRGDTVRLVAAHARAGYPWVLLCQSDVSQPLPDMPWPIVAEAGRFRLLRLSGAR